VNSNYPAYKESLSSLTECAAERLAKSADGIKKWVELVRPKDGLQGRFCWAEQTTREANVASTSYVLGGLRKMGIFNDVITPEDKKEGIVWVQSMHMGNEQYWDTALCNRKTPEWPQGEPWPSPFMQVGMNQYAQGVLRAYGIEDLPPAPPPEGIPRMEEADKAIEWVKSQSWNKNPWSAGSHSMRMATWLLQWYKEGHICIDPLIKVLKFFYEIQDKETGLWGGKDIPWYEQINGTFKLFPLIREQLDLPLPHANDIIDCVMNEFYREDYDRAVGACDEWDNWYVIALALEKAEDYDIEKIKKMAAYRIIRILDIFSKKDGGMSYYPDCCQTNWIGFDMAPAVPQSDVMGIGVLSAGVNVCIDILNMNKETPWTGIWRMREKEPLELRKYIESLIFNY